MDLEIFEVRFDCAGLQNLLGASRCFSRRRSRCGAVRVVVTLVAGAMEASCFGDFSWQAQCRESGWLYFDVQILWQAQHVGHGGGLRRSLTSWQAQ